MQIRNPRIIGDFASGPDPRAPDDRTHRISLFPVTFAWECRQSRSGERTKSILADVIGAGK